MSNAEPVYLIDGSGYIFRAYYATPPLTNSEGFPTNALYAFTRMLLKLLTDAKSDNIVMVFDAGKETFRNELYSEYKANRDECPEDLAKQMPYFRKISKALGLPPLELKGFEADDIIGTIAKRYEAMGRDVVIVSADKDLMQLVNKSVTLWDTMRDRRFSPKEVKEKTGVPPDKVREFLALTGDSSDNIPGLKGVGPKTAVQLIESFGDVETILASAADIAQDKSIRSRKKISEQIEFEADTVRLSKELVTIKTDVPVLVHLGKHAGKSGVDLVEIGNISDTDLVQTFVRQEVVQEEAQELIDELDFQSLMKDFAVAQPAKGGEPINGAQYSLILAADFDNWLKDFLNQQQFCFDVETTSLDPLEAKLVGLAVSWSDDKAYYIPFAHDERKDEQVSLETFRNKCAEHFAKSDVCKIAQNAKFDIRVLLQHDINVAGPVFDTMIAAYLLQPEGGSFGLDELAKTHLSHRMLSYGDAVGDRELFSAVPLDEATLYAAEDAHATWLLKGIFEQKLAENELLPLFEAIEAPLVTVIAHMEQRGIALDTDFLAQFSAELTASVNTLEQDIYSLSGETFNTNSPKQLSVILFDTLGISTKGVKKTKTGYSTNQAVLEKIRDEHPIVEKILHYRTLHKLKTTYVDSLPGQVSKVTGRLHSSFNQTITATGRLSSSSPNLQNIPIQTEQGRRVRKAFIPSEANVLVSADYSQIELRVLAHLSGDENLIAAFNNNVDIHEQTTREILGIGANQPVEPSERRVGKTINFGIIYGMSGFRLSKDLGIPVSVANEYIENYFAQYPAVSEYFKRTEEQLDSLGFVTTLYGRKRFLSQIDSRGRDAGFVKRAALNAPLQGTAADIIKKAMIAVERVSSELPLSLLLQIHDELVFECPSYYLEDAIEIVRKEMEQVDSLAVPLKVDINSGANWDQAH